MKNVNELVKKLQATKKGTDEWEYLFTDLFNIINTETIEPKAESFERQLRGDISAGISEGYMLLQELVETWNGTGNFHSLFKISFENRLKNLVKFITRNKRKHNTAYDVSLSASAERDGEASPIIEVIDDVRCHIYFDVTDKVDGVPTLDELIDMFTEEYPEQAGIINIMISFSYDTKKSEITRAFCEYFGVQKYTPVIQKRVSRSREAFKKFLIKHNYPVNF